MPNNFSQTVDPKNDSLLDLVFKEMTNLKDPLTAIMFQAQELEEVVGAEEIGQDICRQTQRSLRMLQRLFDELKLQAEKIRATGEILQGIGMPSAGKKI